MVIKVSALTELSAAPANDDIFLLVDVSDTSMAASGTTKKIQVANLDLPRLDWVNVLDYGATGNGVSDDTTAIQAAILAAVNGNGVVYFPPGTYNYTHLDCTVGANSCLTLRGAQGYQWWGPDTAGQGRTHLHCTATDALDGIFCHQQQGMIIEDIQFSYVTGYTGILIAIGKNVGVAAGTNTFLVTRCHFISNASGSYMTAKAFIGLSNTVCIYITDCSFMGAQSLIRGGEDGGAPNFVNVVIISRCNFERCTVGQIVNPWTNWSIHECTFEFTHPDIPCAITSDINEFTYFSDIDICDCYFWDPNSITQIPIMQPAGIEWNIRIRNCWFHNFYTKHFEMLGPGMFVCENNIFTTSVGATTNTLIDLGEEGKSVVRITGNYWPSGGSQTLAIINYTGHTSYHVSNNSYTGPWASPAVDNLTFSGNANKVVAVNSSETAFELANVGVTAIDLANEATDTTCFLVFAKSATGSNTLHTNAGLAYNSATSVTTLTGASTKLAFDSSNYLQISTDSGGMSTLSAIGVGSNGRLTFATQQGIFVESPWTYTHIVPLIVQQTTSSPKITFVTQGNNGWPEIWMGTNADPDIFRIYDNGYIHISTTTTRWIILGSNNNAVQVVLLDTGNVGIGTSTAPALLSLAGTSTTRASLNLATGTAPSSPADGDIWREDNTNTGLKIRINGVTKTINVS